MDRRHLFRVDAQLGAETVGTGAGEVGEQPGLVVDVGRDAGHRRRQARRARGQRQAAGGVVQAEVAQGRISRQVEVEREVDGAEDQPARRLRMRPAPRR